MIYPDGEFAYAVAAPERTDWRWRLPIGHGRNSQ